MSSISTAVISSTHILTMHRSTTKLPYASTTGYRFKPRDVELIKYYLEPKIEGRPLPVDCIHDVDIYKYNPLELRDLYAPADDQEEFYFFTPRYRKYKKGDRPARSTPGGFWKASSKTIDVEIISKDRIIGKKATLVYHIGNNKINEKTHWIMHEYKLNVPSLPCDSGMKLDDYVLCRIRENKPKEKENQVSIIADDAQIPHMHENNNETETDDTDTNTGYDVQLPVMSYDLSESAFGIPLDLPPLDIDFSDMNQFPTDLPDFPIQDFDFSSQMPQDLYLNDFDNPIQVSTQPESVDFVNSNGKRKVGFSYHNQRNVSRKASS